MRVYVLNMRGKPLMPTTPSKTRRLLRDGQAKVVRREPFTIQLKYATGEAAQPITLGVDAGSKVIGVSASTDCEELYATEVHLRTDVTELLSTRGSFRRARRTRKTRYRAPRFNNRVHGKHKGWIAPSIEQKIGTHMRVIADAHKILPIGKVIIETASFDIQKIKNPEIYGEEYQQGEQLDFWNVREYVLCRDGRLCQHCRGSSRDKILNVHHIESRKTGGNAPNNLITLCETCHQKHHNGEITVKIKRGNSFRDAAFMGIMRWTIYERLKAIYPNVNMTYGYVTKNTRITNGLDKTHVVDALCIAGHPTAKQSDVWYTSKAVRRHNRRLHKATILKGGYRKLDQAPKYVFGFQLFDKIMFREKEWFICGRRIKGYFALKTLAGDKNETSYKNLTLIKHSRTILTEMRRCGSNKLPTNTSATCTEKLTQKAGRPDA